MISVPDLKKLCWLYIHPDAHPSPLGIHHIMRMMFGGQTDISLYTTQLLFPCRWVGATQKPITTHPPDGLRSEPHSFFVVYRADIYDVHKVGLDEDTLAMYLEMAGFDSYGRVTAFDLFQNCSLIKLADTHISLNVIASKK